MKLYLVTCRGMQDSHGRAYVVASDATAAYHTLRAELDRENLGFEREREMETIALLAEDVKYPSSGSRLHFGQGSPDPTLAGKMGVERVDPSGHAGGPRVTDEIS